MLLTKFRNLFGQICDVRLSPEEVELEKERVRLKREKQREADIKKAKKNIIKKIYHAYNYFSRRYCPDRESKLSKHQIVLELRHAENPKYIDCITKIRVTCEFCDLFTEDSDIETYFSNDDLSELGITDKDLDCIS